MSLTTNSIDYLYLTKTVLSVVVSCASDHGLQVYSHPGLVISYQFNSKNKDF